MIPPLLIFDCDGVLVDSEHINSNVFYEMALAEGIELPYEQIHNEMLGGALNVTIALLEKTHNKRLSKNFIPEFRKQTFERFKTDLKPIEGILHSLEKLKHSKCIASNGPVEKMKVSLNLTGVLPHFNESHIFSAYDIQTWKPAPDLFLYAAKKMNHFPHQAIVIEDSMNGVKAAKNANMKVIAYASKDKKDQLAALNPDILIDDMHDLESAIKELS